ncbi:HNH endonuclease signature motif containing protein [Mucilaginibacter sp. SJ]|uniref:HNH endonuclease signature motif containing protein n=1 Tax=Mucilaginibacter sp. SJ TaxID=3029053 RepID=UPI0023AA0A64|nr:HNH endonuclease signature motif containing protein [Mucilaginibacter sp. SJ]WEA01757.1 HNH endonuclease signature motif containing protein [Mucilaginibacter sp. SJ]
MWKLDLPPRNGSMKNIDKALTKKSGVMKYPITAAEKEAIDKIYRAYDAAKGITSPALQGKYLSAGLLEAMKNAYDEVQIKGRLKKLRDKLLMGADTCPCCGIGEADELDHYLPKEDYQPLSIYSRNLIPYCHKCNNKKRSLDGSKPHERFVNVYYDDIPDDQQFLFAKVRLHGKGLSIKLEVRPVAGLSSSLVTQMNFQMKRVNLNKRLRKALNIQLSSIARYLDENYKSGGKEAVKLDLRKSGKSLQERFGINHWRSVVLFALADHDAFCDGGFYAPLAIVKPAPVVKSPLTP